MRVCPNCAKERDERDIICVHCGDASTQGNTAPSSSAVTAPTSTPSTPTVATRGGSPESDARAAQQPISNSKSSTRNVVLGAAAIAMGVVVAAPFMMRQAGRDRQIEATTAAAAVPAARHSVAPVSEAESTGAPKWKRTRQSAWATDGSRTIGFEVEAEQNVAVYMTRVRPVLAVRCASRAMEVFVVLHSAASIENPGDTHTVKISLDGEPDLDQQWLESVDKQALFAPDGKALATRMATSRHLRFSFKPFNAGRATVDFDVHGFDEPLAAMSKTCDPGPSRRIARRS